MGQVTIYLDQETEKRVEQAVKESGLSKSRWIANLIQEKTTDRWPAHIRSLAGSWKDLPSAEEIRAGLDNDPEREPL